MKSRNAQPAPAGLYLAYATSLALAGSTAWMLNSFRQNARAFQARLDAQDTFLDKVKADFYSDPTTEGTGIRDKRLRPAAGPADAPAPEDIAAVSDGSGHG